MTPLGTATVLHRTTVGWGEHPVALGWLTSDADWGFLREWRTKLRRDAGVAARDSYEYAVLACKRWRFLHMQSLTPESLPALLASLKHDQAQELGIAIALFTSGPPATVLGIAFVRRTWANNLILEFLAGAPGNTDTIKGCGSVLMQTLARIAASLHCRELWGECTALSQGFYIQTKRRAGNQAVRNQEPDAITDRFQFTRQELRALLHHSSVRLSH